MSAEGKFASAQVTRVLDRFDETISLQSPHADLVAELDNVAAEHSLPGWDGDVAPPVSYHTVENARAFINTLPASVPRPDIAVDPDNGAVTFEWAGGYRQVFSVSVSEASRVACAGLDGVDQWFGALSFDTKMPTFIVEGIRRVTSSVAAA